MASKWWIVEVWTPRYPGREIGRVYATEAEMHTAFDGYARFTGNLVTVIRRIPQHKEA